MIRIIASFLVILCVLAAAAAAENPIAGKWNCVSTDERGTEVTWALTVTEEAGKLAGSITLTQTGDKIGILEPRLEGNTFSFKIPINAEEIVELTCRVNGSNLEGTFKGKTSGTGTFKGTRQAGASN